MFDFLKEPLAEVPERFDEDNLDDYISRLVGRLGTALKNTGYTPFLLGASVGVGLRDEAGNELRIKLRYRPAGMLEHVGEEQPS